MRATRDLLRRRTHLRRQRAERLAHGHNTTSPSNRPELGKTMASKATRDGVAERFAAAAGPQTLAVDLARITSDDARRKDLERSLLNTAQPHEANPLDLRPTVPGIGQMLRRVRRDDIHRLDRFPRVPAFASYARLVTCRPESGGTRLGTAGKQIGTAHLTWAFSAAATLCLRRTPPGQKLLARLAKTQATGKARSLLAHQLGRAVSWRLKRPVAFDLAMFLQTAGRRAGEPGASLASGGLSLSGACTPPSPAASVNAKARLGR